MTVDPMRASFDAYAVLGVVPSATRDQVHHAYRELARRLHPDANPGDPAAAERFAQVHAAWQVLGDDDRRRTYDLLRHGAGGARAVRTAPGPTGNTAVRGIDARPSHHPREPAAPRPRPESDEFRVLRRLAVGIAVAIVLFVIGIAILTIDQAPPCDGQRPLPCRIVEPSGR